MNQVNLCKRKLTEHPKALIELQTQGGGDGVRPAKMKEGREGRFTEEVIISKGYDTSRILAEGEGEEEGEKEEKRRGEARRGGEGRGGTRNQKLVRLICFEWKVWDRKEMLIFVEQIPREERT